MASSSCSLDLDLMQIEILHHHYYCEITPTAFIKGQCRDVVGFRKRSNSIFCQARDLALLPYGCKFCKSLVLRFSARSNICCLLEGGASFRLKCVLHSSFIFSRFELYYIDSQIKL